MIQLLEELSLNMWPALQTILYDGWVIRFAGGYTKRSNSVNPIYGSSLDLDAKIARCEALYAAQNIPTVFKLTDDSHPPELDAALDQRGYLADSRTSVQILDLNGSHATIDPDIRLVHSLISTWVDAFVRLSGTRPETIPAMEAIHKSLVLDHAYAALLDDGEIAAAGLAVADRELIGIYDIVTDPQKRRRGFANRIMHALLGWGERIGARRAFLGVMCDNHPALNCYHNLGFEEVYQYWYRVMTVEIPAKNRRINPPFRID